MFMKYLFVRNLTAKERLSDFAGCKFSWTYISVWAKGVGFQGWNPGAQRVGEGCATLSKKVL